MIFAKRLRLLASLFSFTAVVFFATPLLAQNIIRTTTTTVSEAPAFEVIEEDVLDNQLNLIQSNWRFVNTNNGCQEALGGTYTFLRTLQNNQLGLPGCQIGGYWSVVTLYDDQSQVVGYRGECWNPLIWGLYLPTGNMIYALTDGRIFTGTPASPAMC